MVMCAGLCAGLCNCLGLGRVSRTATAAGPLLSDSLVNKGAGRACLMHAARMLRGHDGSNIGWVGWFRSSAARYHVCLHQPSLCRSSTPPSCCHHLQRIPWNFQKSGADGLVRLGRSVELLWSVGSVGSVRSVVGQRGPLCSDVKCAVRVLYSCSSEPNHSTPPPG